MARRKQSYFSKGKLKKGEGLLFTLWNNILVEGNRIDREKAKKKKTKDRWITSIKQKLSRHNISHEYAEGIYEHSQKHFIALRDIERKIITPLKRDIARERRLREEELRRRNVRENKSNHADLTSSQMPSRQDVSTSSDERIEQRSNIIPSLFMWVASIFFGLTGIAGISNLAEQNYYLKDIALAATLVIWAIAFNPLMPLEWKQRTSIAAISFLGLTTFFLIVGVDTK